MLGEVDWIFTLLIMGREVGITVYRMLVLKNRVVPANAGGKTKTIMQGITLGFLLSPLDLYFAWLAPIELVALYLTTAVTMVTGIHYLVVAARKSAK